ncbi:MAG TPA: alpha/beta hydrolase-fold protein [Terriglobia bacterium]|nr:alpha/beta hydrolase-fold protein [Terriglobia bacterium]
MISHTSYSGLAFKRVIGLAALLAAVCNLAQAQGRIECGEVTSRILRQVVRYCAFLPSGYDATAASQNPQAKEAPRYPVLYSLHGLGDNEQSLMNTGAWSLIQDLREQHKIGEFLIVTPDGGRSFYINSRDGRVRYSDFFLQEFIPTIERRYRVRTGRNSRGITGMSMGGYGALRLAFAYPQLFSSVSAHSAALVAEPPRASNHGPGEGPPFAGMMGALFGNPIDIAFWNENSPFVVAKRNAAAISRLGIYFDCGSEDSFGFDQGATDLHRELDTLKVKHEFHIYPGGHSAEYFLAHVAASIEFHSRAFHEEGSKSR